jgi:ferredoxin
MVKYKVEIDRRKCTRCGYCYTVDPLHFEPSRKGRKFLSFFLSKAQIVNGETNSSKSVGAFDDEKKSSAHEAEAICPSSGIVVVDS